MRKKALDFPKSILIETCNLCQGKCKFCPYKNLRVDEKPVFLNFERYKLLIDEIANYPVQRLTLFNNNEPLIDSRIEEFINYAAIKLPDVEITLSTNGRLLTLEKIKSLNDSRLTTLYVSIPTVDEKNYQKVMGYNINKILDVLESIDDPKLIKMIRIAVPKTKYLNHELMVSQLGKYLVCEWGLEYKENWNIDEQFKEISDFVIEEGPCDRPLDQMVINASGNVIICCRDWKYQNVVGNVYDNNLYEIWHSEKMLEIQSYISNQQYDNIDCCKDCSLNNNFYLRKVKKYEISKKN